MRRTAREIALKILFQTEFSPQIPALDWPYHLTDTDDTLNALNHSQRSSPSKSTRSRKKKNQDFVTDQDQNFVSPFTKESLKFAVTLVEGVTQNQQAIDQIVQSCAQHWSVKRMATLDRNILRLGVYEMRISPNPTPPSVVINEYIEISKVYGAIESSAFINGILDQVSKMQTSIPTSTTPSSSMVHTTL